MHRVVAYLAVFTASAVFCSVARAQLVGYWSFDDNTGTQLTDFSGNNLHGTLSGNPEWVAGHTEDAGDYALRFDGSNYVNLGNPAQLAIIGDQTIAMWLYPTDFSVRRNPYAKAYAGSGTITQNATASSTGSLTYYYGNHGGNGGSGNPNPALGQTGYEQRGVSPLTLNAWNFIVVTRDLEPIPGTGRITAYVNGVATASYTPIFTSPDGLYPVVADNLTAYFARGYVSNYIGSIDDAQIYNVALTAREVSWLMANSRSSVPLWDGSEGTWDTASSWSTGAVPDLTGPDTARVGVGTVTYALAGTFAIDSGSEMNLGGTGTWRKGAAGSVYIGQSAAGTVNQTGGTFDAGLADSVVLGVDAGSTGTYNLNGGTLIAKSIGQGDGTAQFSFGGGTLQAAESFNTPLPMTVNSGGATVDTNGHNAGLSGNLSAGTSGGALTKTGEGTLTLDGVLAYTGGTTVDQGTLVLNRAGVLGSGNTGQFASSGHTVTVNEGATLQFAKSWVTGDGRQHQLVANGGTIDFVTGGNYQSYITLTGGHIISRSDYNWRTGNYTNGLITVNPSESSSTISGAICFVKTASATKTTFNVADGPADDDLVISAKLFYHTGAYWGMEFVKDGPGTLVLNSTAAGNNTGGGVTVDGGTLRLAVDRGFNEGYFQNVDDVVYTVNAGGTLRLDGDWVARGNSIYNLNGGTIVANSPTANYNYVNRVAMDVGPGTISGSSGLRAGYYFNPTYTTLASGSGSAISTPLVMVYRSGVATELTFDVADGAQGHDLTVSGPISDLDGYAGLQVVKTGEGTMVLSGTNTFAGNITVADGVLVATALGNKGAAGNLGAGTTITLGSDGHNGTLSLSTAGVRSTNRDFVLAAGGSGTIHVSDYIDISGVISGDGDLIKTGVNAGGHNSGSRLSLSGNNTYSGDTYILEGVIQVARNGGAIPDTSNVYIAGGAGNGRLRLVYYGEAINGLFGDGIVQTYSLQNQTLTVGTANGDGDFSGTIEPGISLIKAGTGTQILSGANTYTGTTTVNGGTLLVNNTAGSGTGTGLVTVNSGATLGGTGTIAGATTIKAGGTLATGTSIGMLTFGNNLALEDGAIWDWEFVNNTLGNYDQAVGPNLILPTEGAITLNIWGLDDHSVGWYDEFTIFTGEVENFDAGLFQLENSSDWTRGWKVSLGNSLVLMAVPEPGAWLLLLSALVSGMLVRRRRR
ncbi:MAG: autotransporter-associated beta strand repeat-containing protein [Thermoguttaceae bacterium]|jgi:autotransporter-associated beta strand protein|nr:autotransporter-associated beta strand repeat-containing protein [Thermoguttaceae bacterium]